MAGFALSVHNENANRFSLCCWQLAQREEGESAVKEIEIKFCVQCGIEGLVTREITPNHVLELYCPHCGVLAVLLWGDSTLIDRKIGVFSMHDPNSDSESW